MCAFHGQPDGEQGIIGDEAGTGECNRSGNLTATSEIVFGSGIWATICLRYQVPS